MADKTFFGRLTKLFSTAVVVARPGSGIKVLDIDKLQNYSNWETNRVVNNKYTAARSGNRYGALGYNVEAGFITQRNVLYRDYEKMDQDPIIASALDIYSDDATVKNEYGDILQIQSDNEDVATSLRNLFYDILNVEFNLWTWIRGLCKYGDFYLKLDITENVGITNAIPLSQYAVNRQEDPTDPTEPVKFILDPSWSGGNVGNYSSTNRNKVEFENYEVAHFRLLSDSNYIPYGRSMLEGGRRVWKQLILMEDAMLIHRIMRAPEKRIFKIDIGNIAPNEVDSHMTNIINKLKKIPYVDEQTGQYNLEFNLMNMLEDFYLPVRGDRSGTEIDTLSGMEFTGIEDIEYLQRKLFASLKIPRAFLTYDEEINAKSTLTNEDARFARTIERIQKIVVSELAKIAIVHLYSQGFKNKDLVNFNLSLTLSSTALERDKMELWTEKVNLARDMKELKMLSDDWIYEQIFKMSKEEYDRERLKIVEDLKLAFRFQQIEDEGNDPVVTNDAIGTPGDNEYEEWEVADLQKQTFTDSKNLHGKIAKNLASYRKKRQMLIQETFNSKKKQLDEKDTFLNENNIIDDEKVE